MAVEGRKKYNIKQYKGLVDNISSIKDNVERDRRQAAAREKALQERLQCSEEEAQAIQKELSVQLRCAGRSYQQLLGATRDLTEQLREEEDRRKTECEALETQVKDLKHQLSNAAKPWKEEVAKRDLKILKLQEAAADQEGRLRQALRTVDETREAANAEIKAREDKADSALREIGVVREQMKEAEERAAERLEAEQQRAFRESTALRLELKEVQAKSDTIAGPYIKNVQELELKVAGLERQLNAVDYTPYEMRVKQKEMGYEKLVKDFGVKQKMNEQNVEKMRAGFEEVIQRMDKQIQDNERNYEAKLKPWKETVAKREAKIEHLTKQLEEFREEEAKSRAREAAEKAELQEQLDAAKGGLDLANQENYRLTRQLEKVVEQLEGGQNPWRKVQILQMQLEETTKKCEAMIKNKDRELTEKTDMVTRLQQHVTELTEAANNNDKDWDNKVQKKEEGYQLNVAQLAYAEGQIVEERGRTEAALTQVKRREETISRLRAEHAEELRIRKLDHDELQARIDELEAEVEEDHAREAQLREDFEDAFDAFRRRDEARVADLRVEMARRERAKEAVEDELKRVRAQFEKARLTWEDKERELEVTIRSRDRQVVALKNEIEFLNDSWEIKYNRLMELFEKLQKRCDELVGPNGVAEAYRRARDLKEENKQLMNEIAELKEMIKKQKRQIRDLQLDIHMHMQQTADLIRRKELGMAKLVGENAKLQTQLREEEELRVRLVQELVEEKKDIVASFQARIDQLEQLVESMRYTDRQELLDKIAVWKHAYQRVCVERDAMEDELRQLIDTKDLQLFNMAGETAEIAAKVHDEKIAGQMAVDECEEQWKKKLLALQLEKEKLERQHLLVQQERDRAHMEKSRALLMADSRLEDPEKDALRKQLRERDEQLSAVEAGVQRFISDNTALLEENDQLKGQMNAAKEDWEPQIRWRDERYEAMVKEHNALKEVLAVEMKKAQDTCKMIEESVRKFPNPFEQEMKELQDKYAQTQAGMLQLSRDNLQLKEELQDYKEEAAREREQLEEGLKMASHILKEVASLGALDSLSKEALVDLETALGVDLDGDGVVG